MKRVRKENRERFYCWGGFPSSLFFVRIFTILIFFFSPAGKSLNMVHYGPLAAADFSHKLPAETMMIKANGSSAYHQDNREASPLDEPPLNFMRNGAALLVAASDLVDQQQQQLAQLTRTRNQFYCDQCNMVFGSKSAHTSHMKSHAKYAAAQQAAAASASAPVAGQDVVVGSSTPPVGSAPAAGGDPYQCDKCNKTFAVPARLVSETFHSLIYSSFLHSVRWS